MNIEEENFSYNEEITSRGNEELEEFQTIENDAKYLETLAVKEDEPPSSELHEMAREEFVETFLEMTLWGEMHKEMKNEKITLIYEVDEFIIHLNNELRGTDVKKKKLKKIENIKK